MRAEHFTRPDPKFALPIEADNAPEGATLEFSVGKLVTGEFRPSLPPRIYPSAKREFIGFSPLSPSGGLVFEGSLQDWVIPLDTSRLLGKHDIRVRMLDKTGKEIARTFHTLIVSDTGPQGVQILGAPKAVKRGTAIVLQVSASDPEVGIKEAQFFMGKPIDNKLPPNIATYSAVPIDKSRTTWEAKVTMPEEKKGPTEITVQVTNNAGLSSFASATINLIDTDPAKTGPGRIKGRVMLGQVPQPELCSHAATIRGRGEGPRPIPRPDGTFLFEEVLPGRYTIYMQDVLSVPRGHRHSRRGRAEQRHGNYD